MNRKSHYFISALCTPLTADDALHLEGLEAHLNDQWSNGIQGVLVGGTMGVMQMLSEDVYRQLCKKSIEFTKGRGEILIGAGDSSLARTLAKVEFLNTLNGVDGVVVLTPYFFAVSQVELVDYYQTIADASHKPIYLYDLPQLTRCKIDLSTVQTLIKHPNIKGIKCSDEIVSTRLLIDAIGDKTRVVVAQPLLLDALLKFGIMSHLDGMFSVAPQWTTALGNAADHGDWNKAATYQNKISELTMLVRAKGVFPTVTAILNARGIPGRVAPRPLRMFSGTIQSEVLDTAIIRELLHPVA
jgi:4-hydroxy-tetrahydrodipicolinate synthase